MVTATLTGSTAPRILAPDAASGPCGQRAHRGPLLGGPDHHGAVGLGGAQRAAELADDVGAAAAGLVEVDALADERRAVAVPAGVAAVAQRAHAGAHQR